MADAATGIYCGARWDGGWRYDVKAALGARAARETVDHRVLGRKFAFGPEQMDRRFCAAIARTWLDRTPQCRNRVSLGGGSFDRSPELVAEFVRLKVDVNVINQSISRFTFMRRI
jgi:hypothetical protein